MYWGRCECVNLETNNNETYWFEVASDIDEVIACVEYNINLTETLDLKKKTKVKLYLDSFTLRGHLAVERLIIPWSDPLLTTAWKVTHVMVASCTTVLKLSVLAYTTSLEWDEIHRVEKLFPIVLLT